ncbi:MAG: sulfite exporter TauE/SafE family protein [Candidatus Latescibacterota bacterium]|jgi:uncharacterized membrane protein YfcA
MGIDFDAQLFVVGIFLFAVIVQTVAGFGLGIVSLPLLIPILGIRTAAPIVAMVNLIAIALIFIRYRHAFQLQATKPLLIAGALGVPIGVWTVKTIPEAYTLTALGILILGYSLYAYFTPQVPQIKHALWGYGLGFVSGICGGAYNSSGPASVLYAHSQRWPQETFKSNLQGYFIINSLIINITHALSHNYTPAVFSVFLLAIPGITLGMIIGFALSKRIHAERFRKLILALLFILGIRLIITHLT